MPSVTGEAGELRGSTGQASGQGIASGVGASIMEAVGIATGAAQAVGATLTVHTSIETQTIRGPFSELGMAERFAANPAFYRNLAAFVAAEIRRQADTTDGSGNHGSATKGQLIELADGFEEVASGLSTPNGILTPEAAAVAATAVTKLRSIYSSMAKNCPELLTFAQVGLAAVALCQFGLFDNNHVLDAALAVIGGIGVASVFKKKD